MKENLLEIAHELANDLYQARVINAQTMREFDTHCLPPVKHYTPQQIKAIRFQNQVSQSVFAAYLNVSTSTIQQWEQGHKKPNGPSLKLLNLVEQHGLTFLAA